MRAFSRTLRARQLAGVIAGLVLAACSRDGGTAPDGRVRSIEVSTSAPLLYVGTTGVASARALDADGEEVPGVTFRWKASPSSIVTVSESGVLTAKSAGTATVTAQAGSVSGSATLTIELLPVANVSLSPLVNQLPRGQTLQLSATLTDQLGGVITGRPVSWSSSLPGVAGVNATGLVTALSAGTATIKAVADGKSAEVTIEVTVAPVEGGPRITAIAPPLMTPGGTITITGTGFATTTAGNEVRVNGVPATVTSASTTELMATLPAAGFGCLPTHQVFVQVVRGAAADAVQHPLAVAPLRALAAGETLVLTSSSASACLELPPAGGRYILSVFNAGTHASVAAGFRLRGAPGLAMAGDPVPVAADQLPHRLPAVPLMVPSRAGVTVANALRTAELDAHARLREANDAVFRRGAPVAGAEMRALPRAAAVSGQTPVGTVVTMRIPNVGGFLSGGVDFCISNFSVNARVVYNGTRAIVLEDTETVSNGQPTIVGQSDSLYRAIGEEFDATMFGIVEEYFASPLRMDDQLDNNGKIIMLFSPRINTFGGLSGFVVSCDFFPPSTYPSSNRAEVFYAVVPTTATGTAPGSRAYWYWTMRSTIIHETKHIAAYANRIRDFGGTGNLEEAWLEEGTARVAEELWARRAVYGDMPAGANATYTETLFCDVRPQGQQGGAHCIGKPYAMYRHFGTAGLYDYLADPGPRSPLGPRLGAGDFTYYASAWSLIRWALDNHNGSEAALLSALVRTSAKGVANVAARLARPWEEIVGEWSLAWYLDDYPGFTSVNPRVRISSWNAPSIFAGMSGDFPTVYTRPFPLVPRAAPFGEFEFTVPTVGGGSYALFDLGGTQTGRQLIELRGLTADQPAASLRIAIARVQ